MLRVPDVDELCSQALNQGARMIHSPQTHVYGERQATLEDFAGHLWTLTQTVEDVDPSTWGLGGHVKSGQWRSPENRPTERRLRTSIVIT